MKIKVLSRNPDEYIRETCRDIHKAQRNYDPMLHPFRAPREYKRALNAVRLDMIYRRPFLGALDGHKDSIQCLIKHPKKLSTVLSGAADGEVKIWNLSTRLCLNTFQAHTGFVRDMCFTMDEDRILTVGDDSTVKTWHIIDNIDPSHEVSLENTVISKTMLTGITHHFKKDVFATCGRMVDIWDSKRVEPLKSLKWGEDTVKSIKFNPIETNLLSGCANDRSIMLYDIRETSPLRKVVMEMCTNKICWNPMEAFVFTAANEDDNLYTYDLRNLSKVMVVHHDHTAAVLDVDYAPTGKEFVSGSYDKTVRIFGTDKACSREVYYSRRMQRLTNVIWSLDNKYVLCGSDEMNIRMWKANASDKLGLKTPREKLERDYSNKLKEKYGNHPKIQGIARYRRVPFHVKNRKISKYCYLEKLKKKREKLRVHCKIETVVVPERRKHILAEYE